MPKQKYDETFDNIELMVSDLEKSLTNFDTYVEFNSKRLKQTFSKYQEFSPSNDEAQSFVHDFILFSKCYLKMYSSIFFGALFVQDDIDHHLASKWLVDRADYEDLDYLCNVDDLFSYIHLVFHTFIPRKHLVALS